MTQIEGIPVLPEPTPPNEISVLEAISLDDLDEAARPTVIAAMLKNLEDDIRAKLKICEGLDLTMTAVERANPPALVRFFNNSFDSHCHILVFMNRNLKIKFHESF